jgi:3-methylfumaryl-CoA hydratase
MSTGSTTGTSPPSSFTEIERSWRPEPIVQHATIERRPAADLAALLDQRCPLESTGDPLPPLWHWTLFPPLHLSSELDEDGHPRDGALTPPLPDRRRMFGGGRLHIRSPLRLGDEVERRESVRSVRTATGSSGPLLLVTVAHDLLVDGELRLHEEQDFVYRRAADVAAAGARSATAPDPVEIADRPWQLELASNPVTLFRFSAVTGNAHRIHYDRQYATEVEGHPGLVVHGPLLAILMLELPRRHHAAPVVELTWRGRRPVHEHDEVVATGRPIEAGAKLAAGTPTDPDRFHATVRFDETPS